MGAIQRFLFKLKGNKIAKPNLVDSDSIEFSNVGNDISAKLSATEQAKYLKTDQTTPQTIVNDIPLLEETRLINENHQLVDKLYVDNAVTSFTEILDTLYLPKTAGIDDLNDVEIADPTENQVLSYDGTNWVNQDASGGSTEPIYFFEGDTASELQILIDLVSANGGGIIQLQARTYEFDTNIELLSNITIRGANRENTLIDFRTCITTGELMTIAGSYIKIQDLSIRDDYTTDRILFKNKEDGLDREWFTIDNCYMYEIGGYIVYTSLSGQTTVLNFYNSEFRGKRLLYAAQNSCNNVDVNNCIVKIKNDTIGFYFRRNSEGAFPRRIFYKRTPIEVRIRNTTINRMDSTVTTMSCAEIRIPRRGVLIQNCDFRVAGTSSTVYCIYIVTSYSASCFIESNYLQMSFGYGVRYQQTATLYSENNQYFGSSSDSSVGKGIYLPSSGASCISYRDYFYRVPCYHLESTGQRLTSEECKSNLGAAAYTYKIDQADSWFTSINNENFTLLPSGTYGDNVKIYHRDLTSEDYSIDGNLNVGEGDLKVDATTGVVSMGSTPVYADNAEALAGGLVAGDIYTTATGEIRIVI